MKSVGLDVHKDWATVAVLDTHIGETARFDRVPNDRASFQQFVGSQNYIGGRADCPSRKPVSPEITGVLGHRGAQGNRRESAARSTSPHLWM